MRAFEVSVNGDRVCTAGMVERGVLSAHVTWLHQRPDAEYQPDAETLELAVGGLASDPSGPEEHRTWLRRPLRVGDVIELRVVDVADADAPIERHSNDNALYQQHERRFYETLKRKYGGNPAVTAHQPRKRRK